MKKKPEATDTMQEAKPIELDPYKLDGIEGLGPIRTKHLVDHGYTTMFDIAATNPTTIQQILACEMDLVEKIFKQVKAFLESKELVWKAEMTATEMLEKRKTIRRLSTGCSGLDTILDGGIEQRSITEFYGEPGSAKSQLGHWLVLQAQKPIIDGGLREEGESKPISVIIDTENKYNPERMIKMLAANGIIEDYPNDLKKKIEDGNLSDEDRKRHEEARTKQFKGAEPYLNNVTIIQPKNAAEQIYAIKRIRSWLSGKLNVKLLIIDSTVALFRSEMTERGSSWRKKDMMNEMFGILKGIAETFNICIVSMNQIYNSPDQQSQYGDGDIPYGGNILGHALGTRIKFEKTESTHKVGSGVNEKKYKKRIAKVIKSPLRGPDQVQFYINDTGLVDV